MSVLKRHKPLLILAAVLLLLPLVLPNNFYYDIAIRMAIRILIGIDSPGAPARNRIHFITLIRWSAVWRVVG